MVSSVLNFIRNLTRMSVPQVIFVLGAPGAGKGTQCQKIVDKYGFVHLSAGDLLREERSKPNSKYGELIENYIREGKIVPVEITCSLLEQAMEKTKKDKFLIDGFPRNQNNLDGWQKQLSNKVTVEFVLFFDCPEQICIDRCLNRGAAGSGRSDDNLESLKKRFNTYVNETRPIIDYYAARDLVETVNGTQTPDEIFDNVQSIFKKRFGNQ